MLFDSNSTSHQVYAQPVRSATKTFKHQIDAADCLFNGKKLKTQLSIIAQGPQSGKTGLQIEIAKRWLAGNPRLRKVIQISNLADVEVTNTTKSDFLGAYLTDDNVVVGHRGQVAKLLQATTTWALENPKFEYLIIADEAHEALNQGGQFNALLKSFGIDLSLQRLNPRTWRASLVVLSATPYAFTLWSKCDAVPTSVADIYYPKMPTNYVGLDRVHPRVKTSFEVFTYSKKDRRPNGFTPEFVDNYLKRIMRGNFYHIIRLQDQRAMNAFKFFIDSDPTFYHSFHVEMFHSIDSDARKVKEFKRTLCERKPKEPTLLLIAGAARAGTRVCTRYIRSMYEYTKSDKSPHDATLVQSFVGRACGYACEICSHDKRDDFFNIWTKRPETVERAVEFYSRGPALGSRWNKSEIGNVRDSRTKCWYVLDFKDKDEAAKRAYRIHQREGIECYNPNTLLKSKQAGVPQPPATTRPIYTISGNNGYDLIGTAVPRYHRGNTWAGVIYIDAPNANYRSSWNSFMNYGEIYGYDCGLGDDGPPRKFKGLELKGKILVMSYMAPGEDGNVSADPDLISRGSLLA